MRRLPASSLNLRHLVLVAGLALPQVVNAGSKPPGPEEGILGPLHKAHQGQIVFATAAIPRDGDTSFALTDSFQGDQPIYARVFMSQTIAKQIAALPDKQNNCKFDNRRRLDLAVSVDGAAVQYLGAHAPGDKTWFVASSIQPQTYDGPFIPQGPITLPSDLGTQQASLLLLLANLPTGKHTVAISQGADCLTNPKVEAAKGSFSVEITPKSHAALVARLRLADAQMVGSADFTALSAADKTTFKGAQVLDFRILEGAWDVQKNALGVPLSRTLLTLTVFQKDQACTLLGSEVKETFEGNGYGAPQFHDSSDSRLKKQPVPCELASAR